MVAQMERPPSLGGIQLMCGVLKPPYHSEVGTDCEYHANEVDGCSEMTSLGVGSLLLHHIAERVLG